MTLTHKGHSTSLGSEPQSNACVNRCGHQLAPAHVLTRVLFLVYSTWGQKQCTQASFTLWIPHNHTHRSHFPPPQAPLHFPVSPLDMKVIIFSEGFEDHCFPTSVHLSYCCSLSSWRAAVTLCFPWSLLKPCWMGNGCSCVNEVDLLALWISPMSIFSHWGKIQKAVVQLALEENTFRKFLIIT